ncbi:S1C family serine protease [Streptomyces sp. CBMA29]|uniref:S1C family serine protease n=1 Tax=Streptomyces sp. CBMA29 TaxID=1896314 RepID=UPI002948BC33|nr:trypsin-like peptidase domain-containing protein [Streptomyces sp. CBMA29]
MSTENEAGSGSAAESAAPAPDGASAAQAPVPPAAPPLAPPTAPPTAPPATPATPPAPAAPPASADGESRTEILPEVRDAAPMPPADPYRAPADPYSSSSSFSSSSSPAPSPSPSPSPYGPPSGPPSPYGTPPASVFAAEQPPAASGAFGASGASGTEQGAGSGHGGSGHGGGPHDPFAAPSSPYGAANAPGTGQPGGPGGLPPAWGTHVPPPPNDGHKRRGGIGGMVAAVLVAALVAGGVGGGVGYAIADHNDKGSSTSSTTVSDSGSQKAFNRAPTSVAGIANKALPSVVTIKASGSQESGTGTGFVYDTEGHILTNNHVVAPAANGGKLTVTFSNGKTYDAAVIGRAQGYDVAVVKLKNASGVKLTPLPLGNSDQAQVGDATIAIGAPFGLSGTVTTGIVSAVHRPVASSDGQGSSASYMSAIQTDASINPGNSGGPLLNANGAVIGINSAIQPAGNSDPGTQGGSVGLGFAIPINQAKRVADQLIKTGQPVYPVIGVSLDTQYQGDGAKISTDSSTAITSGGPGANAGLKPGDVITRFDDTLIDSGQTLIGEIWQHSPGDKATITYTRNGTSHTTTVTLGQRTGDSN